MSTFPLNANCCVLTPISYNDLGVACTNGCRYSAVVPDERMSIIKAEDNFIRAVVEDHSVVSFGLNKINTEPMSIASRLLPPAKLKYGGGQVELKPPLQFFLR